MKNERLPTHRAVLVCLLLASLLITGQAVAMPGFDTEVAKLCAQHNRASPVFNTSTCTSCHTAENPTAGNATLRANGLAYQAYLADPSPASLDDTLNAYCLGAYYNLHYDTAEQSNTGTLPPAWNQTPANFQYSGSLEVYWLARLGGDYQSLLLSRDNAALQSNPLPANFNLLTAPDNCWGHQMNFGLLTLDKKANLTVTVAADASQGSSLIPGFALYKGWDSGPSSVRHDTIFFGDNNPLGTTGLTYLGQALSGRVGDAAEKTFVGLEPGDYTLFVTVGTNQSSAGGYTVKLATAPTTVPLTVNKTGQGAVTSAPAGISCGSTCAAAFDFGTTVTLTATANAGHRFKAWVGCPNASGETCTVTLDQSRTVSASFEQVMQSLTVQTSGTGTVIFGAAINCGTGTPGLCQALFAKGSTVTLSARDGALAGWGGACSGNGPSCVVTMDADRCVTALFADGAALPCDGTAPSRHYALTVSGLGKGRISGGGIDCGTLCKAVLAEAAEVVLTATPEQGYAFKGWSGACAGTAPSCSLVLNSDQAASAEFMPVVSVAVTGGGRVTSDGGTIDCGAACSAGFASGTPVTLTAVPQTGFRLAGWSGCAGGAAGEVCALTVNEASTVSALFEAIPQRLTVLKTGEGRIVSTPAGIDCGSVCSAEFVPEKLPNGKRTVTLEAVAATGYAFAGWSGCTSVRDNLCYVTMDRSASVAAAFTALAANEPAVVDGACGSANDAPASASTLAEPQALCLTGTASTPAALADGRSVWSCLGVGEAMRGAKCYTLGANGKLNQPPLALMPGDSRVSAGAVVRQTIVGGGGKGAVRMLKSATPGVKCKLARKGRQLKIKVGGGPGTCTLTLVKAKDARFNAVESFPAVITVQP